jgi:hypothetical protein
VSLNLEAHREAGMSSKSRMETTETISLMLVTQSQSEEGYYRWIVEPGGADEPEANGGRLKGHPWDARKNPRLKLRDDRTDRSKGIAPAVRVEVRCRREDLAIEDIHLKDSTLWERLKKRPGSRNRMIAAEAYIREKLTAEGLEVRNIHDHFGILTIASVTAEPS